MSMLDQPKKRRAAFLGVFIVLLLGLYSCASVRSGPVDGRVIDADTGKPITSGVAYGIWDGVLTSLTRTDGNCIWVETVRLNEQGRFSLPAWQKLDSATPFTSSVQQSIFVYAPGYEFRPLSKKEFPEIKLKRFAGAAEERFHELKISPCVPDGSERHVAVVYRMMAGELKSLAKTYMQEQQADSMYSLARAASTDRSKPTLSDHFGRIVNSDPNDQYPE
jgi:hypothetical protein